MLLLICKRTLFNLFAMECKSKINDKNDDEEDDDNNVKKEEKVDEGERIIN